MEGGTPAAGPSAAPGPAAPHAVPAGAPKDRPGKPEHTPRAAAATPEEVAEAISTSAGGENGGQGDGDDAADAPQRDDEAVSKPCASSAGKRKRTPGPGKPARKAACDAASSSPGRQQQRRTAPGSAAREAASPAGEQRAQKHRILDLSHIRSFAQTARGALDQLRGGGPRRRTADVTLKSKAVRLSFDSEVAGRCQNSMMAQDLCTDQACVRGQRPEEMPTIMIWRWHPTKCVTQSPGHAAGVFQTSVGSSSRPATA